MRFEDSLNRIVHGDCIERMGELPAGSIDLVFADPPFNIGYDYDVYDDKQERGHYLDWSRRWIGAVHRALKPNGTFWLAIGDEYAAELKVASQEIGFHCRSWVIWYYTFGVNCKNKFSRSHAHLFYFVKDPANFTFRAEAMENRIPSARQLVYADTRANPVGRLPDDTWVLRPQDLADCFTTAEDTWYFPRVAGTFKERAGFHGCQMPEQLLGRIIRTCSHEGELVMDPFSGSATTVAVAKKLGRRFLGFDLSEDYVRRGMTRLEGICVGDPLDGAAEPTVSAPRTPKERGTKGKLAKSNRKIDESHVTVSPEAEEAFCQRLLQVYQRMYEGYSLDRMVADPELNRWLTEECERIGLPGDARTWNETLFRLRKRGAFAGIPTLQRTEFAWEYCEPFLFASEIAWRQMVDQGYRSLETILSDPIVAASFDGIASRWSPGFKPLEYRWAAIKLRKSAKEVRARADILAKVHLSDDEPLNGTFAEKLPASSGVYMVIGDGRKPIYAGEASNIRERLPSQFGGETRDEWKRYANSLVARYFPTACSRSTRLAYQHQLVQKHQPLLNLFDGAQRTKAGGNVGRLRRRK